MKSAYWSYWLVMLGIFIVVIMMLLQNITTSTTQTYSMLHEISEASMVDAIDFGYYRQYGEIKINKEKFMEVFLRRMAETVGSTTTYDIEFHAIVEAPPKVSVQVSSKTETFNIANSSTDFDIVNRIDAILELG